MRRRLLFIAVLALVPLLLLGVIEGALRLAGFGGYPPTFTEVGTLHDGSALIFTDAMGPNSYFFATRSQGLALDPVAFVMPKPENTVRVVWAGGSAAKGIPQPRPLRASAFLETMLEDLWPERDVEVINIGTPGIGSYPVLGLVTESLDFDPDLIVAYLGNNEFYGAYGVASLHAAGRSPFMLRLTRVVRSTAIAQAMDELIRGRVVRDPTTLMEAMVGRSDIDPRDPARADAARNLGASVRGIVDRCRARDVPVIVCTPPCNEVGMGPMGEVDPSGLPADDAQRADALLDEARAVLDADPVCAETALRDLIEIDAAHATAHHLLGRALTAQGRHGAAAVEYRSAVDLDPMPWRPPTTSIDAIRGAVHGRGAVLVDLVEIFRRTSTTGAVGWDLIEDHVHPSLRGQVLVARSVVLGMTALKGELAPDPASVEALPDWREYARRHGANPYARWGVALSMTRLASVSFFERAAPDMRARNAAVCEAIELGEPSEVVAALRRWGDPRSDLVDRFPIAGLVAEAELLRGRYEAAGPLYRFAAECSTPYGSRRVAFTYLSLNAERAAGESLSSESIAVARESIDEGRFLIDSGWSTSGQAERFVGQLHQLLGEHAEALPYLLAARERVTGGHVIATDEALVRAYLATGRPERAREIVDQGLAGQTPGAYIRMRDLLR